MNSAQRIMSERKAQVRERTLFRLVLPYFNLIVAAGLTIGLVGVTRRLVDTESENRVLELELANTRAHLESIQKKSVDIASDLEMRTQLEEKARRADFASYERIISSMESRLDEVETVARKETAEASISMRQALASLRETIHEDLNTRPKSLVDTFRQFEVDHRQGVVLIYTEFDYFKTRDGKEAKPKTVSGWGSGFFLTEDGHLITNKHVVEPWKFDPDLAAMVALGEIRVDEGSLRVYCWQAGTNALDATDEPDATRGFNTHALKNLKIVARAPDSMNERDMDVGSFGPSYKVHALDNNDLVIMKAEAKTPFHALPIAKKSGSSHDSLRKLDTVMALGFPRGQNGLESGIAESSPSLGSVRKIEETIHVTASIIPGNSGGPLVGPNGQVHGVVTRVYSETLGICIKIDHALALLDEARAGERKVAPISASLKK